MDLEKARSEAKICFGYVEGGKDPKRERRRHGKAQTFRVVAEDFMRLHVAALKKPRTHEEYGRLLRLHIYPALGDRPMDGIGRADLAKLHTGLASRPSAANRCLALFDTIWNWAKGRGDVEAETPSKGIQRNPERPRERYLTPDEMRRLGKALYEAETVGLPWTYKPSAKAKHRPKAVTTTVLDPHAVAAIRLLMLTGARLREILEARWDYVDWDRGMMFLPDSKTGRKTLYLSTMALSILAGIERVAGNPFIIPGSNKGEPRADLKRPWAAITKAAGLAAAKVAPSKGGEGKRQLRLAHSQPGLRIHDLRHTFAAMGAGSSLGLPVIGKLLGHSQSKTTQRYAHLDADPMHKAANMIGAQIAAAQTYKPG